MNRRRNPAVPFGQLVERRNSRRIAQHHGDLSATGDAFSFALGAGLGIGHSGSPKCVVGALRRHIADVCVIHALVMLANAADGNVARLFSMLGWNLIDDHRLPLSRAGLDGGKANAVEVHGLLQSGVIPPMDESYSVTSNSQHLSIVRRNSERWAA